MSDEMKIPYGWMSIDETLAYYAKVAAQGGKLDLGKGARQMMQEPKVSRRLLAKAFIKPLPKGHKDNRVDRVEVAGEVKYAAKSVWLPPKHRRRLSTDLAAARKSNPEYKGKPPHTPRQWRRAVGDGPWPKLSRRTEKLKAAYEAMGLVP